MRASVWRRGLWLVCFAVASSVAVGSGGSNEGTSVWRYTVRPGDTLIALAERYLGQVGQWKVVQELNDVEDPYRLLPGTVLRIPVALLRRVPAVATIEVSSGVVRWRRGGGEWQPVVRGQRLIAGSTLQTLDDASALVRLADGSTLLLSPNSQLEFESLAADAGGVRSEARLRLQQGQSEVRVNPARRAPARLQIQTPAAQAVVRGTVFRLRADEDLTREETLRGLVGVQAGGGGVSVGRGMGTVARMGARPLPPIRLLPPADLAALPARFEQLPLRFPLPRLRGADGWLGEVMPDAARNRILTRKTARGEALTFADLANGDYLLRLRAVDVNGLQGHDAVHRFVVFARPFPPVLNAPGDAATIRSPQPTYSWSSVQGISGYRLQLAREADFAVLLNDVQTSESAWQASEELPPGQAYWRVASIDASGLQGPWAIPAGFTYKPGPGPVDLGRAAIEVSLTELRLRLPPPPEGLSYEVLVSPSPAMENVVAEGQTDDGALDLPRPDGGTWFLGVRLRDRSDNTRGPLVVQTIDLPYSPLWLLLLLLPLAW